MSGLGSHERRWASDTVPGGKFQSAGSSPGNSIVGAEEFVEVTLDLQEDDTIILRSVEPASASPHGSRDSAEATPRPASSRSPSIARSSSHRLRQFSQEMKAEAVAKARQFSQELKAEMKRFSWSHGGHGNAAGGASGAPDSALAARAMRQQRAQLDRTWSGARKALKGLRFISKASGLDGWNEVQTNFDKLARDDHLSRSDFAQCIGCDPSPSTVRRFTFWKQEKKKKIKGFTFILLLMDHICINLKG